jgi:hypothetical protein
LNPPAVGFLSIPTILPSAGKIRDRRHLSGAVALLALDLAHQLGTRNQPFS